MQAYFVYIIYSSQLDRYYIGQTDNLERRLEDHLNSRSSFTKKAKDWILMYSEEYPDRSSAMRREREIKSKKSRKYIEYLLSTL